MYRWFLLCFIMLISAQGFAQELDAKVTVTSTQVQGIDPKVFKTLETNLNQFLNSRKWTDDNYQNNEKISCNFQLNITKATKEGNLFSGILTVVASRPVYNSTYNTTTLNTQDKEVSFSYDESQTLEFNENNVAGNNPMAANLTAIFAYYVYYILGLDYDSFSPDGGTQYFQKAQNICDRAPDQGNSIQGWKSSGNKHNRYWMVEEMLNPKFKDFVTYWYTYHRKGLDFMADNPKDGLDNILAGIPILQKIQRENTNPVILQMFFDAKSTEWVGMIQQAPMEKRQEYVKQMMSLDIINAKEYQNIK